MSSIIIDGISNTGKTTLIKNIQTKIIETGKYKYSNFFISEHLTERFFEEKNVNVDMVAEHIINILNIIKSLNDFHANSPFSSKNIVRIYIERLFATFYSRGLLTEEFFIKNGELISSLRIRHILLYISKNDLKNRLEETFKTRNDIWKNYVNANGGISKFVDDLLNKQDIMLNFSETILSKYVNSETISVSNIDDNFYNSMV